VRTILLILAILFFVFIAGKNTFAVHQTIPAETQKTPPKAELPQIGLAQTSDKTVTLQALIKLLEKKGVITKIELREEIENVKQGE
jgi:hypothetical protein